MDKTDNQIYDNKVNKFSKFVPVILMILSVVFWGYSFISTKIVLKEMPPISIAFFRQLIAAVPLLFFFFAAEKNKQMKIKHVALLGFAGFFGIVLYFIFENTGLRFTSASNASMIVAAVPVFTLITEGLFFKLKISAKMVICIIVSIIGVYFVISSNGSLDFSSKSLLGNLLVMGAMLSWIVYTIINKGLNGKYSSITITTMQTVICAFLFIPFIIPEVSAWKGISLYALLNLLFLGLFCSAAAYFCFIYASKRLGASVASAYLNLIPVVSVIFGNIILGEKLSLIQYIGMSLIILSLLTLCIWGQGSRLRKKIKQSDLEGSMNSQVHEET